jgi:predicted HNH restriction endonuclease
MARKAQTENQEQGICVQCNTNVQMSAGKSKLGFKRYIPLCSSCHKNKYGKTSYKRYQQYKKDTCEECGFVPKHIGQLDVHHIDHNHRNNEESNLKTLCANCHRLEHL